MTTKEEILQDLQRRKRSFEIDGETHWVVEGDLVLDAFHLGLYAEEQAAASASNTEKKRGLVAMEREGKLLRWPLGKVLTYTIRRDTFVDQAGYDKAEATWSWRPRTGRVCVVCSFATKKRWTHRTMWRWVPRCSGCDSWPAPAVSSRPRSFRTGEWRSAGSICTTPTSRRRWGSNRPGVLRHELGHVLGFRHEHIRIEAPMDCPDEPMADTRALTEYDPESVMHYFCGGLGNKELAITAVDRQGARDLYGRPKSDFFFPDD